MLSSKQNMINHITTHAIDHRNNIEISIIANPDRPHKVWQDYVREDLAKLNMPYNWHKVAHKREEWRSKIQRLLLHT